jgi:hypothetical protein
VAQLPFLILPLWPLLNFWSNSITTILEPGTLLAWMVLSVLTAWLLSRALSYIPRIKPISTPLAGAFVALIFLKPVMYHVLLPRFRGWALITFLVLLALGLLLGRFEKARAGFRAMAAGLVFMAATQLAWAAVQLHRFGNSHEQEIARLGPKDPRRKSNVYYFILDGYNRNDVLKEYFGFDNAEFSSKLGKLGFFHASRSSANYPFTLLSVPAAMKMEYFFEEGEIENWIGLQNSLARMMALTDPERVPAFAEFKRRGYETIYAHHTGERVSSLRKYPIVGDRDGGVSELNFELIKLTPALELLGTFGLALERLKYRFLQNPLTVLDQLPAVDRPFFFLIHILSPHPPFTYEADCTPRRQIAHIFSPEDLQRQRAARADEGFEDLYLNQVRCLNARMIEAVERIIRQDPGAVIVIHSDHGYGKVLRSRVLHAMGDGERKRARFGIQAYLRLPGIDRSWLYDSISPVNMVRLVLAYLDGDQAPRYLPDRSFAVEEIRENLLRSVEAFPKLESVLPLRSPPS